MKVRLSEKNQFQNADSSSWHGHPARALGTLTRARRPCHLNSQTVSKPAYGHPFGLFIVIFCVGTIFLGGCATASRSSVATAPAILEKDFKKGRGAYWYSKPDVASVDCGNFDSLWNTAFNVARDDHFMIDRTDFREGLLTTQPLISKQFFELWRDDVVDTHSMLQSSLGTVRRTIQFHISREPAGGYRCIPKVLVERESLAEHRITSVTEYHDIFSVSRQLSERDTDFGTPVILDYWYAIGRDPALERDLAGKIRARLKSQSCDE